MNIIIPDPDGFNKVVWDEYKPTLLEQIEAMAQAGVTFIKFDEVTNSLGTPSLFLIFNWDGTIRISVVDFFRLSIPELKAMLKVLPDVLKEVQDILVDYGDKSIFYSDIYHRLKKYSRFAGKNVLFSMFCSYLTSKGFWVHS